MAPSCITWYSMMFCFYVVCFGCKSTVQFFHPVVKQLIRVACIFLILLPAVLLPLLQTVCAGNIQGGGVLPPFSELIPWLINMTLYIFLLIFQPMKLPRNYKISCKQQRNCTNSVDGASGLWYSRGEWKWMQTNFEKWES